MTAREAYDLLRDRLRERGFQPQRSGAETVAYCPRHEADGQRHKKSLSFKISDDDKPVISCGGGCPTDEVLAMLDLTWGDLLSNGQGQRSTVVAEYEYRDEDGKLLYVKERHVPKSFLIYRLGPDGRKIYKDALKGVRRVLFGLAELRSAVIAGGRRYAYLPEGEKDVLRLRALGEPATTWIEGAWTGARPKWRPEYTEQLRAAGVSDVIIIRDRDDAGHATSAWLKAELEGAGFNVIIKQSIVDAKGADVSDHLDARRTLDELEQVDDPAEPEGEPDILLLLPRIDWHELWADDGDEEWILYPLIPNRRGIAIYSPAKIGKSLLMLEIAVCLSLAKKVLGHTLSRRYRVLYVDFENDPRGDVRTRLQDMGYGPDDLDHLDYLSFPALTDLDTEQGGARLMAAIAAYGSEVVVIDTISRAVEGEENSNDTWLDFYRYTGLKLKRAGVTMVRLDHTGKDEAKGQRGGSAKGGDVDAVWRLTVVVPEQRFRLECTFHRFQLDHKLLNLIRRGDPLRHVVENLSAVTEREAKILHIIELADEAGLPADAGRRELSEVGKSHQVKARNDVYNEVARRRKADPKSFLRDSHETLGPLSEKPDSADLVPDPSGTNGDQGSDGLVPGPHSIGGDQGTVGPATCQALTWRVCKNTNCRTLGGCVLADADTTTEGNDQ